MEKIDKFWQWFTDHNEQLIAMGDLQDKERDELLGALQYQLTKYCDGLTYEMGEPTANGRTLTFTAEGDTDLFRYVVELVDAAPDLDWWEFVAFKQPMGTELKVRFDRWVFDTRKMYFEQLECEEEPDMLGLRIAVEGSQPENEDFQVGVYVTLEALDGRVRLRHARWIHGDGSCACRALQERIPEAGRPAEVRRVVQAQAR